MTNKGFTLIELMIVIAIICILVAAILPSLSNNTQYSFGINGITETRCIDGYKFVVSSDGSSRQIYDNLGYGVQCNTFEIK